MFSYFAKFFHLGIYLFFISSQFLTTESLVLDELLNVFKYCTIHVYNYRGLLISPLIPVTLYQVPFEIVPEIRNYERIRPIQCQAAIYILPSYEDKSIPGKGRNNNAGYYSRRIPSRRTYIRYDVLVDDAKRQSRKLWASDYSIFLSQSFVTSFGLITEIEKYSFYLSDKLEIIHIFKVSYMQKLVTASMSLRNIRWNHQLYQAVMNIHDIRKNKDVQWTLQSDVPKYDLSMYLNGLSSSINRVRKMFELNLTSPAYATLLRPTKVSEEGMENFLYAITLLGPNVNLTKPGYRRRLPKYMVNPRITFNVPQGTVMMDTKRKESAYVSCSTAGGPQVHKYTFQQAVMELLYIFEIRIYFGLIATYIAPPILLGVLYHCVLKKRIKKEYWVSWHPFGWGIRALILQAGNRRFNNLRFGWTTFMVVPWLLVALVISSVFRKHVLHVMGTGGRLIYPWNVLEIQHNSGVTMVTDNERLAMKLNSNFYADSFLDIAYQLMQNDKMTYISWEGRAKTVAKIIGHRCPNSWQPVKYGRVYYWGLRFLGGYSLRSEMHGWVIEKWVDNSIWDRLAILNGESGIFGKWRETLERLNDYQPIFDHNGRWVVQIGMNTNMVHLFYCVAGGFLLALLIWIAEWVFFKAYTEPRRKWMKKMDTVRNFIVNGEFSETGDSGRGSIHSGGGIEDEIVNEAVMLVNERKRSSLVVSQTVSEDLKGDENEMKRTNVDEAEIGGIVTEAEEVNEENVEVEKSFEQGNQIEGLEITENLELQENSCSVTDEDERVHENSETIEQEEVVDMQDNCEEIENLMVETTRSSGITICVTRSESRVSFADPLETIIEPKLENQTENKASLEVPTDKE